MIDNIKIELMGNFCPESFDKFYEPYSKFGTSFYPRYNQKNNYIYHSANFGNLTAKINYHSLVIENSLHKFYHGNNNNDFKHSEIINAVEQIEDIFSISSNNFKFKRVETAINIVCNLQLHKFINHYKMDRFKDMSGKGKCYGAKCFKSEFNIKSYDKSLQIKLDNNTPLDMFGNKPNVPDNLNRFEIEYKRMKPLKGILFYLSDIKDASNLKLLGDKMVKYYDVIEMSKGYDYSILTPRQRELVFAGRSPEFWDIEKINMNTRKKKRKEYNKCLEKLNKTLDNDPKKEVRALMIEKINYLISN